MKVSEVLHLTLLIWTVHFRFNHVVFLGVLLASINAPFQYLAQGKAGGYLCRLNSQTQPPLWWTLETRLAVSGTCQLPVEPASIYYKVNKLSAMIDVLEWFNYTVIPSNQSKNLFAILWCDWVAYNGNISSSCPSNNLCVCNYGMQRADCETQPAWKTTNRRMSR